MTFTGLIQNSRVKLFRPDLLLFSSFSTIRSELDNTAEHRAELEFGILYETLDSLKITVL